jgi:hypothetical protein
MRVSFFSFFPRSSIHTCVGVLDLHDNSFVGTMPKEICDRKLEALIADCYGRNPEVQCDCCTVCCAGLPSMVCVDTKTGKKVEGNVY